MAGPPAVVGRICCGGCRANIVLPDGRITELDQQAVELRRQLSDRDNELNAARAPNQELMARLNNPITNRREKS